MLIGCRETLVRDRARGLVGYDVALTRRRSPVRIRPGPLLQEGTNDLFTAVGDGERREDPRHLPLCYWMEESRILLSDYGKPHLPCGTKTTDLGSFQSLFPIFRIVEAGLFPLIFLRDLRKTLKLPGLPLPVCYH